MFYTQWIVHATSTVDQILEPLYMQLTHTPAEKRDNDLIAKKREKFQVFTKTLNDHLKGKEWLCGNTFTAADCVVIFFFLFISILNLLLF